MPSRVERARPKTPLLLTHTSAFLYPIPFTIAAKAAASSGSAADDMRKAAEKKAKDAQAQLEREMKVCSIVERQ